MESCIFRKKFIYVILFDNISLCYFLFTSFARFQRAQVGLGRHHALIVSVLRLSEPDTFRRRGRW